MGALINILNAEKRIFPGLEYTPSNKEDRFTFKTEISYILKQMMTEYTVGSSTYMYMCTLFFLN